MGLATTWSPGAHAADDGHHVAPGATPVCTTRSSRRRSTTAKTRVVPSFARSAAARDDGHGRLAGEQLDGREHPRVEGAIGVVDLGLARRDRAWPRGRAGLT